MWVGVLDALESLLAESSDCYDHNWNSFMQADVLGQLLMTEKVERGFLFALSLPCLCVLCSTDLLPVGA